MNLGLLDHGIDLRSTIVCAKEADTIGFSRYWLTEHHGLEDSWSTPEIVLALIGATTRRIRVGSAGTLLMSHNPLRVACDFTLLASALGSRVDLGLARGRPTHPANRELLGDGGYPGNYDNRVARVKELIDGVGSKTEAVGAVAIPNAAEKPMLWILGSGQHSATIAATMGIAYSHSLFFNSSAPIDVRAFRDAGVIGTGRNFNVAVAMACGETEADVERTVVTSQMDGVFPNVRGTPDDCAEQLQAIASRCDCDEIIVLDMSSDLDHRLWAIRELGRRVIVTPTDRAKTAAS